MRRLFGKFARARSGMAAVEFALAAPILVAIVAGIGDFALAFCDQTQLADGVAVGVGYAFSQGQSLVGTTTKVSTSDVQSKAAGAINLSGAQISVTPPSLYCVAAGNGTPPIATLTVAAAGSTCPNGSPPGTFMFVTATYRYVPLMPFYSTVATTNLSETGIVRLY